VISTSAPSTLSDRRTAIDVAIIKESVARCSMILRWIPTDRMLADALTKDKGDPADLLRAVVRAGVYQIADVSTVLQLKANEKQRRKDQAEQRARANRRTPKEPAEVQQPQV